MRTTSRAKAAGFTLTELMIAVAVLGVLTAIAVPNFRQLLRNYEVRGAAESVAIGLQKARGEAVARNTSVQFVLGTGTSWTVSVVGGATVDSRAASESPNATKTGLAADLSTAATTLTFNNIGLIVANADASQGLRRVTFSAPGASETLRVEIGAGGSSRVCDPSLPSTNARAC